jgi:hypothetical protein
MLRLFAIDFDLGKDGHPELGRDAGFHVIRVDALWLQGRRARKHSRSSNTSIRPVNHAVRHKHNSTVLCVVQAVKSSIANLQRQWPLSDPKQE